MHGTTSLLVPGIYDRADDSVTTYHKLEAVSAVDTEASACFFYLVEYQQSQVVESCLHWWKHDMIFSAETVL